MGFPDYEEFIAALNGRKVRYLIVGAHAVAYHARPRATKDLDILLERTPANARKMLAVLRDFFGGKESGYTVDDLMDRRSIIQIGVAPVRIDLLADLPPWSPPFKTLWRSRVKARFGSVRAPYLALDDLIRTKELTGRMQDRADLRVLKRAQGRPRPTKRIR